MSSENQDGKVLLQKRLIHFLEDESKISTLSNLLDIVENGTFDSTSSNIENFYSSYNDLTSKKQEIDGILDDVKDSQVKINNAYNEIYDIHDDNIELKDSSSILNNLRQAGNDFLYKKNEIDEILDDVKKSQEQIDDVYNEIYDINDSNIELKDSSSILNNLRQANDDLTSKKQKIDGILDDVKDSQVKINNAYNEIYDIHDDNIELKDSSSILNNLRQAGNDFLYKKNEIDEILDDVKKSQEQIDDVYNEIYDINDSNIELKDSSSILNNLRQANDNASKIIETYIKFYGQEDVNGVPTQGIISKLKSACEEIEESMDKINELKDFYKEVFEGAGDGENLKDDEKALVDFLADKRKELADTIKRTREDLNKLKGKIEELLPGATSAGLADAYKKQREDAEKGLQVWNKVFWASVSIFIVVFAFYLETSFKEGFSYVSVLRSLPLWVFSGFFTFYSTQQISEYKRISNEYRHKESLASSYVGFEKLIEETENEGLRIKLLENTVEAIKTNPSDKIKEGGRFPSLVLSEKFLNSLPLEELKKLYDKIGNIVKNQ